MASRFCPLTQSRENNAHYFPIKSNKHFDGPLIMSPLKAIILELWPLIIQLCFLMLVNLSLPKNSKINANLFEKKIMVIKKQYLALI